MYLSVCLSLSNSLSLTLSFPFMFSSFSLSLSLSLSPCRALLIYVIFFSLFVNILSLIWYFDKKAEWSVSYQMSDITSQLNLLLFLISFLIKYQLDKVIKYV